MMALKVMKMCLMVTVR